jgi:hypothetical protein
MNSVTLRKVPGGLALGLLASLAAHAALYGGDHGVGGAYHALLMQITSAGALGFVALIAGLAWTQSMHTTDGSILAGRLRERLPGAGSVIASAAVWYAAIEAVEPHHAGVSAIALIAVLSAASYLVLRVARAMTDVFASAAIAISRTSFLPRVPGWRRRQRGRLTSRQSLLARRRFARPPPIAFA